MNIIITTLDNAAQGLAWLAGKVAPTVRGAGVSYWPASVADATDLSFIDAWREPGAYTVRLGRLEVVVDLGR